MLVYANSFVLSGDSEIFRIVGTIAEWMGRTRKTYIDPDRLFHGIRELKLTDGSAISSLSTSDQDGERSFPYYFCAKLTHGQDDVSGRRWIAEVGIKQEHQSAPVAFSILLRTDEISARVNTPIQVTRPAIVKSILERFTPISETPGLTILELTEDNATAFSYEIDRPARTYPIIQVSCDREGIYPVSPIRIQSLTVGLAQVIKIGPEVDTWKTEEILGRRYVCFGGAISILFPPRSKLGMKACRTVVFRPDEIQQFVDSGISIESEVLSTITHYTNLPQSWKHNSTDIVAQEILRGRLRRAVSGPIKIADAPIYETLLQDASDQIEKMTEEVNILRLEIDDLRAAVDESNARYDQANAEIEGLKYSLTKVSKGRSGDSEKDETSLVGLRNEVAATISGEASLSDGLNMISTLYGDRVTVLESAIDSAKRSDSAGFNHSKKAIELLFKLCENYWSILDAGGGDQQARAVFGQNGYSAKEADSISKEGRARRTFSYNGRAIEMEKHLKIGVKDSSSETLRVHFEWISDEHRIVVGHCGKHLDF